MHSGCKLDVGPTIVDSAEFGAVILKWWHSMQPKDRLLEDGALSPLNSDSVSSNVALWSLLAKAGPNSIVSLIMLMVWWGCVIATCTRYQEASQAQWVETVHDITNVLLLLKSMGPEAFSASGKCKADHPKTAVSTKWSVIFLHIAVDNGSDEVLIPYVQIKEMTVLPWI